MAEHCSSLQNKVNGAAAWDDLSGMALDPQLVHAARLEEMEFFKKMGAYTRCDRECVEKEGGKLVDIRWLDVNKGDSKNPVYRFRLVGREFNNYRDDPLYAATPPLEALRVVVSYGATNIEGHNGFGREICGERHCQGLLPCSCKAVTIHEIH